MVVFLCTSSSALRDLFHNKFRVLGHSMKHFAHPISTSFCRTFLNPYFSKILYFKPPSSRSESTEGYWVCIGWRGVPENVALEQMEEDMQRHAEKLLRGERKKELMEIHYEEIEWRAEKEAEMQEELRTSMDLSRVDTSTSRLDRRPSPTTVEH